MNWKQPVIGLGKVWLATGPRGTVRTRFLTHFLAWSLMLGAAVVAGAQQPGSDSPEHPGPIAVDASRFRQDVRRLDLADCCDLRNVRPTLLAAWADQYTALQLQLEGRDALPPGAAEQVLDPHSLCFAEDGDPLGVVLRRTGALLEYLEPRFPMLDLAAYRSAYRRVSTAAESAAGQEAARQALYFVACALRRQIAFRNPLLDFERILFVVRGNDTRDIWSHRGLGDGRHFVSQYYAFASLPGGGIYTVDNFKQQPAVSDQIRGRMIDGGPFDQRTIDRGVFLSPELSYDARRLLFSWAPVTHWDARWDEDTVWQIYQGDLDGDWVTQLTSGPYNDFDPCYLPDGRIVFVSERRGGYARCFDAVAPSRNFVLHTMQADGSELAPISWFESAEWQPSVAHDGRIVYTRWDYIDRDYGQGQNFWSCYPDGRDPRAPHGNYPHPHYVPPAPVSGGLSSGGLPDADLTSGERSYGTPLRGSPSSGESRDSRMGRPFCEFNIRAVPGSSAYVAAAVPQHGLAYGALVLIDMARAPDDGHMSQVRRLTPYQEFPETEGPAFSSVNPHRWATPWPLSDSFYLCNYLSDLCLLDRFGNLVVLCERQLVPGWEPLLWTGRQQGDNGFRLLDPIPVQPRVVPPVIPQQTHQGGGDAGDPATATISILDVYDSDFPLPDGVEIKWLRIVQPLAKSNSQQDDPDPGFGVNAATRMSLGLVPVESDGSVYCEAPVGKPLLFQLLDQDFRAVHGMRSATYVHPGEQLACVGCHERPGAPATGYRQPLALQRQASRLEPDVGGVEPINFFRSVQPVFQRSCVPCHTERQQGPQNMSYALLQPYVWYYFGGETADVLRPENGGTRTMPGKFGAMACRMGAALMDQHHRDKIPAEDLRRVLLWLDNNSPLFAAYHSAEQQRAGQLVWPKLDCDPENPQGLERLWSPAERALLEQPSFLSVSPFHRLRGTLDQMRERPDWTVTAEQWDGGPGEPRGRKRRTWSE